MKHVQTAPWVYLRLPGQTVALEDETLGKHGNVKKGYGKNRKQKKQEKKMKARNVKRENAGAQKMSDRWATPGEVPAETSPDYVRIASEQSSTKTGSSEYERTSHTDTDTATICRRPFVQCCSRNDRSRRPIARNFQFGVRWRTGLWRGVPLIVQSVCCCRWP